MPTLKGTEASLSYIQCFLYLVSSSINVSIFHITCLDTFWTDLDTYIHVKVVLGTLCFIRICCYTRPRQYPSKDRADRICIQGTAAPRVPSSTKPALLRPGFLTKVTWQILTSDLLLFACDFMTSSFMVRPFFSNRLRS